MTHIILISVYLLSALSMYRWTQCAYSKNGTLEHSHPNGWDILAVIIPGFNTSISVYLWVFYYPIKNHKIDTSKFFRVKK